jgi:para-aminobenzoate synthetase/4-amino-4-deoxychorismate lyase
MKHHVVLHDAATQQWLHFHDIQHVLVADTVDAVVPVLRAVEEMISNEGLFAAGFISYEASPAFDASFQIRSPTSFPLLWFGLYTAPDIITLPQDPQSLTAIPAYWTPSIDRASYEDAIVRILSLIHI